MLFPYLRIGVKKSQPKAVFSLPRYTDTQIHKRRFFFYAKVSYLCNRLLCICFVKKVISLPRHTDTHYKMTIFYLCIRFLICSMNRRPNICLFLGYQQIHRCLKGHQIIAKCCQNIECVYQDSSSPPNPTSEPTRG